MFTSQKVASVRPAAVAGTFYPGDSAELRDQIHRFLLAAHPPDSAAPKAVVVPHAGYIYSGPIAASVYARLSAARGRVSRVVLIGPSHRVPFRGLATSSANWFDSPLGRVPVDRAAYAAIQDLPGVVEMDEAHALEHSLEVQIPFLQEVLAYFDLVPLVAGSAGPETVGHVLERLWGGEETLIVISSDLSHYHPYREAQALDRMTTGAIEALRCDQIDGNGACGCIGLNGLLWTAARRGMTCETVDLRNSGDTAGDRQQVVGYGGYVFH